MKRRFGLRAFAGLTALAAAAVVALMVAGSGAATSTGFVVPPPDYQALTGNTLHASQVNADSTTFNQDCSGFNTADGVLWHFVLVQTTAVNTGSLRAEFQNAGVTTPDVLSLKHVGGVLHWDVITPSSDVLLNASTDAVGGLLNLSHVCDGGGGGSGGVSSDISTTVHLGATDIVTDPATPPTVVDNANPAALGSTVHDSANLTFTGTGTQAPDGSMVFFSFFTNGGCTGDIATGNTASVDVSGATSPVTGLDPELVKGPLGAGNYSYIANFVSGNSSLVADAAGDCEPFTISKGDVTISTDIHDANHNIVTTVHNTSVVHDTALISGANTNFAPDLTKVSFTFFTNATCTPDGTAVINTGTDEVATDRARSADSAALVSGGYSYLASFGGDTNYNSAGPATCEPLTVRTFGYTMGFWGNTNGQKLLADPDGNPTTTTNAFNTNPVTLGLNSANSCWILVDTASKSKTILPNTLNGMSILQNCTTSSKLDSGINTGSLNTLLAQTLALSYNILYKATFAGQTIGGIGCTAVGSLTSGSSVEDTRDLANYLIAHAKKNASGGDAITVTQTQIGAMNTLLGCMNTES
jgi:hypothetical protein